MPKKKEPTVSPVTSEPVKTASKTEAVKAPSAPAKTEAAKSAPVKAVETPAPAKTEATKTEAAKPTPAKPTPAKAKEEKPAAPAKAKSTKAAPKVSATENRAGSVVTVVVAKYDVGYGSNLYIRGDSAGLGWETGTLMKNVENDVWVWTTNEALEGTVEFKFLINDEVWCTGENMSAPAGETTTLYPTF